MISFPPAIHSASPYFGAKEAPAKPQSLQKTISGLARKRRAEVVHYSKFLALMVKDNWLFATRPNADGVIANMTLLKHQGKEYLLFIKTKRPPIPGDQLNMEPVAGLNGDTGKEGKAASSLRESEEEIGLKSKKTVPLFSKPIPSSPGMTDEKTNYFVIEKELTDDEFAAITTHVAEGDGDVIRGQYWLPLDEFLADMQGTLEKVAEIGIPTKDMTTGLLLLMAHLQKTGRLKLDLVG